MKRSLLSLLEILTPLITFAQETLEKGLDQKIDEGFKPVSDFFSAVI